VDVLSPNRFDTFITGSPADSCNVANVCRAWNAFYLSVRE
jgi:hypothetical protein